MRLTGADFAISRISVITFTAVASDSVSAFSVLIAVCIASGTFIDIWQVAGVTCHIAYVSGGLIIRFLVIELLIVKV